VGIHQYNETKGQMNWHFVSYCPPLFQFASIGQLQIENTSITSYILGCVMCTVPFIFVCHGFNNVKPLILSNYVLDHIKVDLAQRLLILELVDTASAIDE